MGNGEVILANKRKLISNLFNINLKYVNNYSEFVANSLNLNWNKFLEAPKKDRYLEKIKKSIDKIRKNEDKQIDEKYIQEIIISNLLYINKNKNDYDLRYTKKIMLDIQKFKLLSDILEYLLQEFISNVDKPIIKREKQITIPQKKEKKIVENVQIELPKKKNKVVVSSDKNGSYYMHINFVDNVMVLDNASFQLEVDSFYKELRFKRDFKFNEDNLKYSSFEKKRRIYVKSMYDIDLILMNLLDKKIDITYPVDKIFKCAREIVNNIYKEIVTLENGKSVLNNLMNLNIEKYGSSKQIELYNKLMSHLDESIPKLDIFVRNEILDSSKSFIVDNGYKEFRNIKEIFPNSKELYIAANEKIISYVRQDFSNLLKNLELLKIYTKHMNIDEIVKLYNVLKNEMLKERVKTLYFISLQRKIFELIKNKFECDDEVIFKEYLLEDKLF